MNSKLKNQPKGESGQPRNASVGVDPTVSASEPACPRILLLEDDPLDARLIRTALTAAGLGGALTLVGGAAAFAGALDQGDIDLVLADYNVPGFDGLEALELVRGRSRRLPFIFVTGALGEERAVATLRGGATDYVLKDHLPRLGPAVRRALAEAEESRRREHAEAALKESEEQLRLVLEFSNDAVFWADLDTGRITRCNRKAETLTGRSREELMGMHQTDLHPADRDYAALFRQAATLPAAQDLEAELLTRTGKRIPVLISSSVVMLGRVRVMQGLFRDITERKKVEKALEEARADLERKVQERTRELDGANARLRHEVDIRRQKEEQLQEAHDRYRTVADFTYDWEYWQRPDGALVYCSPSCERVTGYSVAQWVADPALFEQIVHPDDLDSWHRHSCEVRHQSVPQTLRVRIRHRDGQIRWIEHSCRTVYDTRGQFLGVRGSNRDITGRMQAEMETQHLRDELARISRVSAAGQLAAALAHELNQPLGAIVLNAEAAGEYLAKEPPALPQLKEILRDISSDGKRAGDVIHRLRALYQNRSQERTALQINQVIQDTAKLLRSEFVLKDITLDLDLAPDLPALHGNYVQLQQVLINVAINALDAMAACAPGTRLLGITTRSEGGEVRISLRDTGTGIPPEQLGRVGEPFFTTKPSGMGMGLAISRSIIEAHQGRLRAGNHPEGGAIFYLDLPAAPPLPPAAEGTAT